MQSELQSAFNFTDEDLALNKIGEIGPNQLANLNRTRLKLWGCLLLLLVSCSIFSIYPFILARNTDTGDTPLFSLAIGCGIAPTMLGIAYALWNLEGALERKKVTSNVGILGLYTRRGRKSRTWHYIRVENQEFRVSYRQFMAFNNGRPYRIYYVPQYKFVVGVEEIT